MTDDQAAPKPQTVKITSPDGSQTLEVSRKAFVLTYRGKGYTEASASAKATGTTSKATRLSAGAQAKAANLKAAGKSTKTTSGAPVSITSAKSASSKSGESKAAAAAAKAAEAARAAEGNPDLTHSNDAGEGESTIEGQEGPESAEAGKPESSGDDPTGEQPDAQDEAENGDDSDRAGGRKSVKL